MLSLALHLVVLPVVVVGSAVVPIEGEVIRRFDRGVCMYCPGHRGVTIDSRNGDEIVAVAEGVVSFAGEVGGRRYVVQNIAPNVRVTYGGVFAISPDVHEGQRVEAGHVLAVADESTYLGVRIGQEYVEPLGFLGLGQVRLRGPAHVVVGSR